MKGTFEHRTLDEKYGTPKNAIIAVVVLIIATIAVAVTSALSGENLFRALAHNQLKKQDTPDQVWQ